MIKMKTKIIKELKQFYTSRYNDSIELYIDNYDNGTTVLSVNVDNTRNPENIGLSFKEFIQEDLIEILRERELTIVGIYDVAISFTWCNVKFFIDTVENAEKYKKDLVDLGNDLIDYGNTLINTEIREFTIFDYDKAKIDYTNLILKMLSRGYELSVKNNNNFLDCSDDRIKEVIENKEYRRL